MSAAALAMGATLTLAPAANALPSTGVIEVFKVGGSEVNVAGTDSAENVLVRSLNGNLQVSRNSGPAISAGVGCTKVGTNVVECPGTIATIRIDLFGGNDKAQNDTSTFTGMFGGRGADTVVGGFGADKLLGGLDGDNAQGRGGVDTCIAETESSCEN
jgi:hypothetical protein